MYAAFISAHLLFNARQQRAQAAGATQPGFEHDIAAEAHAVEAEERGHARDRAVRVVSDGPEVIAVAGLVIALEASHEGRRLDSGGRRRERAPIYLDRGLELGHSGVAQFQYR